MSNDAKYKYVLVETMPDYLRASHRAAGNWGIYPQNGATREVMSVLDAELVIEADDDRYAHIVREATKAEALACSWKPRTRSLAPDFGDVEDYYYENEITPERSAAWDHSRDVWDEAIKRAIDAADDRDLDGCRDALADARRAEEEWGDWPETRRIRDALALPEEV